MVDCPDAVDVITGAPEVSVRRPCGGDGVAETAGSARGWPFCFWNSSTFQLPEPSERANMASPAAVTILAEDGRISVVALWVSVRAAENSMTRQTPAPTVSNAVMVVVPVMRT